MKVQTKEIVEHKKIRNLDVRVKLLIACLALRLRLGQQFSMKCT